MDELLRALHTLKNECKNHSDCMSCPLYYPNEQHDCRLGDPEKNPEDWTLRPLNNNALFLED